MDVMVLSALHSHICVALDANRSILPMEIILIEECLYVLAEPIQMQMYTADV
jgi:hypothetical protein